MKINLGQIAEHTIDSSLNTLLDDPGYSDILIYGAGSFGKEMYHLLRQKGYMVTSFLDRAAAPGMEIDGTPVYRMDASRLSGIRESSLVIFSIVMDKDERKLAVGDIQKHGFPHVLEAQALRCMLVEPDDFTGGARQDYYHSRLPQIARAGALFREKLSRDIFVTNVNAHISRDYTKCGPLESPMAEQYFPTDIPLQKGYSRFIDCGGFTGDTTGHVLSLGGQIEALALFEPDIHNFRKAERHLGGLDKEITFGTFFPCAVSDNVEVVRFQSGYGSGTVSSAGDIPVLTVSIDSVLKGFHPSFVKMDIEGQEVRAVNGAEQTIRESRPDLAICVYHHINHIWDIPLLIDSWKLGYHFYLRSYNACTMETVLYAVSDL